MSTTRILLVTDTVEPTPATVAAIRGRADSGPISVQLLVANPAAAEWHPLHPDRHEQVDEALAALDRVLPALSEQLEVPVTGSVANDHDPFDAIEHLVRTEQVDEVLIAMAPHAIARRLHLDLAHRVAHLGLPVSDATDLSTAEPSPAA